MLQILAAGRGELHHTLSTCSDENPRDMVQYLLRDYEASKNT